MNDITETPQWGFFALVSYIPDPLGSFLHGLRQTVPGEDNPQPHITILPPRPLKLPVDAASQQAQQILLQFTAFEVELSEVRFFPDTNVLYLDITNGNAALHQLHAALDVGDLKHREEFDFRPHITLGRPALPAELRSLQQRTETAWCASKCSPRFTIDEIVFLWLSANSLHGEWRRLWSHRLGKNAAATQARAASAAVTNRTC